MTRSATNWYVAATIGVLGLLGFANVGQDVFAHHSPGIDAATQAWMLAHQDRVTHELFATITIAGGITGMRVLALAGAAFLFSRGRRRVAIGMLAVPFVANWTFDLLKRLYARPRPLGLGAPVDSDYSYPSGHATTAVAVCCTLAYVLWREGYLRGWLAGALAVGVPILVGISRLYLNVHWATDVLGGWSAGLLIAALSLALYDRVTLASREPSTSS